ncbi:MAG TPA: T9SS type A sorting domain-containing protein [Panacibacter sp.]|nr:T9SS type A sorting domain-containing protein [Panacibacter sp.]
MQGNAISKTTNGNSTCSVNVKKLVAGTYYVKIDVDGKTETIKFIKE